jgi:arsenite methyltransferase
MSSKMGSIVQEMYGAVAQSGLSNCDAGVQAVAEAFGYSPEELQAIPADANMGLSCGNPTAFANLRPGEVLVDLGCGGGLDVFLAAEKLGPTGKAIGIDMTPAMIERARRNAETGQRQADPQRRVSPGVHRQDSAAGCFGGRGHQQLRH